MLFFSIPSQALIDLIFYHLSTMKIKFIKIIYTLLLLGAALNAQAATWSFVMIGDTRDEDFTTTGVSPHLNTIAQKIASLSLKPDFVVVVGDLCNGNCLQSATAQATLSGTTFGVGVWNPAALYPANNDFNSTIGIGNAKTIYSTEFQNWKNTMQPVFDYNTNTGIPIYTVRGNHESNDTGGTPIQALKDAYYEAFSSYVPQNGPNDSYGNQLGFSWSLTHNNVTIVAADQYFGFNPQVAPPVTVSGYQTLNQPWVVSQFQQSTAPYKILMAHQPFFPTEGNGPGMEENVDAQKFFGTDASGTQTRTTFWNNIGAAGARLYLTGHLHLETVATILDANNHPIIQLTAGNGGAPPQFYVPVTGADAVGVNLNFQNGNTLAKVTFGFSVATVTDSALTIQYYSLDTTTNSWSVDNYSTTITPVAPTPTPTPTPIPEPSSMILITLGIAGVVFFVLRRMRIA